jgi:hypothetical protein
VLGNINTRPSELSRWAETALCDGDDGTLADDSTPAVAKLILLVSKMIVDRK